MEIKFDVYFKKNLGTLFKNNEVDLNGLPARTNLQLVLVDRLEINYKVGSKKYTDIVTITDATENLIQIPFKSDVVKKGLNEFEIVAYMKNGDIKVSQTYTYNIDEAIGEGKQTGSGESSGGHAHNNLTVLNTITQAKVNEWNNKAESNHGHSEYANVSHTHNASEIEGLENVDIDLSNYYTKSETDEAMNDKANKVHTHNEYLTENELNTKGFATETYVQNKIAEASLSGGEVDLSGLGADLSLNGQTLKLKNSSGQEIGTGVTLPSGVTGSSITDEEIHSVLTSVFGERYIPGVVVDVPCTNLQLTQTSISLRVGDIISITASPVPSNTTDEIIWSASNDNCTVVDGTVTAIKAGDCVITARCGEQSATCNVTVQVAEQPTEPTLSSISAVYTQGETIVYTDTLLDTLKTSLVVTANYSDGSNTNVTNYVLSGNLVVGTSTVTVTYEGKTTTFNVAVSAKETEPSEPDTPVTGEAILNYDFANVSNSTTVTDLANGNNGILDVACTSNDGAIIIMDGKGLVSTNDVTLDGDFTITMELISSNGNSYLCAIGDVSNTVGKYFSIRNFYGTIQAQFADCAAQKYAQINSISGTSYNTEYYKVKVTKVGTTMTLYVNDVEQGTTQITPNIFPLNAKLYINKELRDGAVKSINRTLTVKTFKIS